MIATQHREATKGGKRHGQIRRCKKTGEEKTTENSQREEAGKAGKEKEQIANTISIMNIMVMNIM